VAHFYRLAGVALACFTGMLQAGPVVQIVSEPNLEEDYFDAKAKCTPALESQNVCHNYQLGIQPTAGYTGNQAGCLAGNGTDSFGIWAPNGNLVNHGQAWLFHSGCPAGVVIHVKMDDGTYLRSGVVAQGPFSILLKDDPGRESDLSLQYLYGLSLVRSGRADVAESFADAEAKYGALARG